MERAARGQGKAVRAPGSRAGPLAQWHGSALFDALTAFRLDPGDTYQLRHERAREHHVLASAVEQVAPPGHRSWLLHPRELFQLQRALAQLRRGDSQALARVRATTRAALARASQLRTEQASSVVLRARHCAATATLERLKVEELAEEVGCSPFHLTRLFQQHLGSSPHRYRLHLRLAIALQRLEHPGTRLVDLAFKLGFSSQSHFGEACPCAGSAWLACWQACPGSDSLALHRHRAHGVATSCSCWQPWRGPATRLPSAAAGSAPGKLQQSSMCGRPSVREDFAIDTSRPENISPCTNRVRPGPAALISK